MKTQFLAKYNHNTGAYYVRVRYDDSGFQDEITYEIRPRDRHFSVNDVTILNDPSEQYAKGTKFTVDGNQLAELIFTGGY